MTSTLSERLKLAMSRRKPKATQRALAAVCGISAPSVSEWFTGQTKVIMGDNAVRAARFLGVNVRWLTTGEGPMYSEGQVQAGEPILDPAHLDPDAVDHWAVMEKSLHNLLIIGSMKDEALDYLRKKHQQARELQDHLDAIRKTSKKGIK